MNDLTRLSAPPSLLGRLFITNLDSENDESDSDTNDSDFIFVKYFDTMPKKANAHDYTNRASSGEKLGSIIANHIVKDLMAVAKLANRKATGDSTADGNSTSSTHDLDIKAPGKDLGDKGVFLIAMSLKQVLQIGNPAASLALVDLNLSGNNLTTASLAHLAPVIHQARYDLKTLVVSNNNIKVTNDTEAAQWETFLRSFRQCKVMRRLDVSGNPKLGARAFEALCRVHTSETQITPVALGGDRDVVVLPENSETAHAPTSPTDIEGKTRMTAGGLIPRRCGLRAIPYIDLRNTGIDMGGALWLSYVVEDHFYPNQLISELNATTATTTIEIYQQAQNDHGIDWRDNPSMGKEALGLLHKADAVRKMALLGETPATITDDADYFTGGHGGGPSRKHSRSSGDTGRRGSYHVNNPSEQKIVDLDSVRKHFQRAILVRDFERKELLEQTKAKQGTYMDLPKTELWVAATTIITLSRKLLFISPITRKQYSGDDLFVRESDLQLVPTIASRLREDSATYVNKAKKPRNQKVLPEYNDKMHPGDTLAARLEIMFACPCPEDFLVWQEDNRGSLVYCDRSIACHLPLAVLEKVMAFATEGTGVNVGVVSEEGKVRCFGWGQERKTLGVEREWVKWEGASQVWMVLERVGCLSYGG